MNIFDLVKDKNRHYAMVEYLENNTLDYYLTDENKNSLLQIALLNKCRSNFKYLLEHVPYQNLNNDHKTVIDQSIATGEVDYFDDLMLKDYTINRKKMGIYWYLKKIFKCWDEADDLHKIYLKEMVIILLYYAEKTNQTSLIDRDFIKKCCNDNNLPLLKIFVDFLQKHEPTEIKWIYKIIRNNVNCKHINCLHGCKESLKYINEMIQQLSKEDQEYILKY